GIRLGPVLGDAEADKRVRVLLARVDLCQQALGAGQLLGPAGRRDEPHLLIRQLSQGLDLERHHDHPSFWSQSHASIPLATDVGVAGVRAPPGLPCGRSVPSSLFPGRASLPDYRPAYCPYYAAAGQLLVKKAQGFLTPGR